VHCTHTTCTIHYERQIHIITGTVKPVLSNRAWETPKMVAKRNCSDLHLIVTINLIADQGQFNAV
jgi:hypothetical protein